MPRSYSIMCSSKNLPVLTAAYQSRLESRSRWRGCASRRIASGFRAIE
jgi:hypothetical protein